MYPLISVRPASGVRNALQVLIPLTASFDCQLILLARLCMPLLVHSSLTERGHPGQRRRHRLLLLIRLGRLQQPLRCPPQFHVVLWSGTTRARQILDQCQVCVECVWWAGEAS